MNNFEEERIKKILLWHCNVNILLVCLGMIYTQNLFLVLTITVVFQPLALATAFYLVDIFSKKLVVLSVFVLLLIIAIVLAQKSELSKQEAPQFSSNMRRIKEREQAPQRSYTPKSVAQTVASPAAKDEQLPPSQRKPSRPMRERQNDQEEDQKVENVEDIELENDQPSKIKRPMITRPIMDAKAMATATLGKLREAARRRDCIEIESLTKEITEHIEIPSDVQERVNKVGCP